MIWGVCVSDDCPSSWKTELYSTAARAVEVCEAYSVEPREEGEDDDWYYFVRPFKDVADAEDKCCDQVYDYTDEDKQ